MSYGLFEHMAYTDDAQRVERRKAIALARVRANKRFARFLSSDENTIDRESRLTLVAGDIDNTVRQACAEVGYTDWESVRDAITASLGFTVEAVRMPKMCPYHREVADISLAAAEPQAGYNAMAQHAWGANHCQGEWEGACRFKPEMVTQSYWDNKAQRAQERKEQRELELSQQPQPEAEFEVTDVLEPEMLDKDVEMSDLNEPEFADQSNSGEELNTDFAPSHELAPAMARRAEALETVDVTKGSDGPIPVMNKDRWSPTNISWDADAQMDGSPVPTRHQDIMDKPVYDGDGFSDNDIDAQTRAGTETQSVTQGSKFSPTQKPAQLPSQTNPVTSAEDPDKNPLLKEEEENEEQEDE